MINKFETKKDWEFGLILLVCSLAIWLVFVFTFSIPLLVISIIISTLFLWIWFGTYYLIEKPILVIISGPIKIKIPIQKIMKITSNTRSWIGIRLALSFEYLKIEYSNNGKIYISLKDEKSFIQELKSIKPSIVTE